MKLQMENSHEFRSFEVPCLAVRTVREIFLSSMIAMVEQIKNSNFGTGDYIRIIQNYCDLHEKEGTSISNCFERLDDENMAMYCYLGIVSFFRTHIQLEILYRNKF